MGALRRAQSVTGLISTAPALRVLGLASLALTLPTETFFFVTRFAAVSPQALPGLVLLVASQLLTGVALLTRRHHRALPWLLLAMLLGAIVLMMRHTGAFEAADVLVPGYWAFPMFALAMRSGDRRDYVPFAALGTAALLLTQHLAVGTRSWEDLADHLFIIQPAILALLFGDAVISVERARRTAVERQLAARQDKDELERENLGQRAADDLLDRHVLPALQRTGAGQSQQSSVRRRGQHPAAVLCAAAWQRVRQAMERRRTAPIEVMLQQDVALESIPLAVEGRTAPVPTALAEAVTDATRAFLLDVGEPARAARVLVRGADDARKVVVTREDTGPGLEIGRLTHGDQIFRRMDDVGGAASTSGDGRAVLTLRWPRDDHAATAAWREAPNQLVRRKLTRTAWPTLVTTALMTLLVSPRLSDPRAGLLTGLGIAALGILTALVLQRRALSTVSQFALLALAIGAWAVNLWLLPESPALDYPLWIAWGSTAVVHLVVLSGGLRIGAVLTALWTTAQVGGLVLRYGWELASEHSFLVVTGAGDVLVTLLVLWVARWTAAQEAEATDIASRLRAAATLVQMRSGVQHHWGPAVTEGALPLLRRIAAGELDPADPRVQADARWAVQRVRRERSPLAPLHAAGAERD